MFVNCKDTPTEDLYKILIGSIIPRPIAWVSTIGVNGVNNLAPFSFFNCFGVDPPMVGFAPGFKSITKQGDELIREPKDTMRNVIDTQEFVVNLVSKNLSAQMNQSCADYPNDVSEFDKVGLTPAPSETIKAPRVLEAYINLECKLIQLLQHGNNNLVLGEIICMHIDDQVIDNRGHIKGDVLQAVGRMAGNWYTTTTDGNFALKRPIL
ncbi:MAG: flavin reductase family protein [Candidatus Melainabacteria bacterium]|nr:flavin reductase family protein [Candidatus Melainabacteria bacterium]